MQFDFWTMLLSAVYPDITLTVYPGPVRRHVRQSNKTLALVTMYAKYEVVNVFYFYTMQLNFKCQHQTGKKISHKTFLDNTLEEQGAPKSQRRSSTIQQQQQQQRWPQLLSNAEPIQLLSIKTKSITRDKDKLNRRCIIKITRGPMVLISLT